MALAGTTHRRSTGADRRRPDDGIVRRWLRLAWVYAPSFATVALLIGFWEFYVQWKDVSRAVLPAPSLVVSTLIDRWPVFWDNLGHTVQAIGLGFLWGFVVGVVSGVLIVQWKPLARTLHPLIVMSQTIPVIALAPLLIIWLGFGIAPRVVIVTLAVFFPITINLVEGLRSAEAGVINLMRSYSATRWQIFRTIQIPTSLPYLFTAIQIAVTYSVISAVVAEWVGSGKGLGKLLVSRTSAFTLDVTFAAILLIVIVALLLFYATRILRRLVMPWERAAS